MHRSLDAGWKPATFDRLGRPRTPITTPGYRRGQHPPNYGMKLPAEPLTAEEVGRLLDACPRRGPVGVRNRALIVLLWRAGLRCAEALALELRDVDRDAGTLNVRHGKGNLQRIVGLDPVAFEMLEIWLKVRAARGVSDDAPVFCTVSHGSLGKPLCEGYWRSTIKRLGRKAGIRKRVHSHGLRHTHAVELTREGVRLPVIQKQLGHKSLSTTQRYTNHLYPGEVIEAMQRRHWPLPLR